MRPSLLVSLALLAASPAFGAEKPIPQDLARTEAFYREFLDWNRKTFEAAYERVGKKDPRWDKFAREALDFAARADSDQFEPEVTDADIHPAAKKAVEAGCDDPLILYLYARTSRSYYPGLEEYTRRLRVASEAMARSQYPPIRRAYALLMYVDVDSQRKDLTPEERAQFDQSLDAVMDLLPKSFAEDPSGVIRDYAWCDISGTVIAIRTSLNGGDDKAAYDRVDAKLVKIKEIEALRLAVRGVFFVEWGWKARGDGYAASVTDEQFRVFHARLSESRRSLERAWEVKSDWVIVPNTMLTVEIGIGNGDRATMEKWFERGMQLNANNANACKRKMLWLEPKWHGDANCDEMVAFGKACAATQNWRNGIILHGVEPHYLRFRTTMEPSEWSDYLKRPEVWADFAAVYPEFLKHRPNDYPGRNRYAAACFASGHIREAHEQFQILGDHLAEWRSAPRYPLDVLKKWREEAARYVEGQKK